MSEAERDKWNATYASGKRNERFSGAPAGIVDWLLPLLAPGARILDLGAGLLRNALPFAEAGHEVLAVDVAEEGFRRAPSIPSGIETLVVDLDDWRPEASSFDLILAVHYLNRRLLPDLQAALRPGGLLAAEIRVALPEPGEAPPPFRLHPGEIRELVPDLILLRQSENADKDGGLGRYLFQRRA